MDHQRLKARRAASAILYTVAVTLTFILHGALNVLCAQTPAQARINREEMESRQRALSNLEKRLHSPPERQPDRHLIYQQSKKDFEQMQIVSDRLSTAVVSGTLGDYRGMRKDAADIRKRAARLKTNLLLPKPDEKDNQKEPENTFTSKELAPAVAELDALIKSFVWNPIFQQPDVVNVQNSLKARHDLDGIIRLSEQIRKSAEALGKISDKSF